MKGFIFLSFLFVATSVVAATSTDDVFSEVRFSLRTTTNVQVKECLERLLPATNANKFTCRIPLSPLPDFAMGVNYNPAKSAMNPDYIYLATRAFNFPLPTGGTTAFRPSIAVYTYPEFIEVSFVGPSVIFGGNGNNIPNPPMNRAEVVTEITNIWTAQNLQNARWVSQFFLLRR